MQSALLGYVQLRCCSRQQVVAVVVPEALTSSQACLSLRIYAIVCAFIDYSHFVKEKGA